MGIFNKEIKLPTYYIRVESNTSDNFGDFDDEPAYKNLKEEDANTKLLECKNKIVTGLIEDLTEDESFYNWKNVVRVTIVEE